MINAAKGFANFYFRAALYDTDYNMYIGGFNNPIQ